MKNIYHLGILAVLTLITLTPDTASAAAYEASAVKAVRVTPEITLFTISYNWGFDGRDTYFPVLATRGLQNGSEENAIGYEIVTENGLRVEHGTTTAILLGEKQMVSNEYKLAANVPQTFTLLIVYEHEPNRSNIAAQVTSLPFRFEKEGAKTSTFLREHELAGFKTPALN